MLNYRISDHAEEDIVSLTAYTLENFGEQTLDRYLTLIEVALLDLCKNPSRRGVTKFEGEVMKFHLRHSRTDAAKKGETIKKPRHIIFFREAEDGTLEILRLLHDSMDVVKQLNP